MTPEISHEHHYVPRWYQKQFLAPGQDKLWYLDLKPEKVVIDRQRSYTRQALRRMYPAECFWLKDLYILRLGKSVTDVIEKIFFETVDEHGHKSVQFFATPAIDRAGLNPAYNGLLGFIAAQKLRTPRGLDWLRRQAGVPDQNRVLMVMWEMFKAYNAMWMEGTWEIVSARIPRRSSLSATTRWPSSIERYIRAKRPTLEEMISRRSAHERSSRLALTSA